VSDVAGEVEEQRHRRFAEEVGVGRLHPEGGGRFP